MKPVPVPSPITEPYWAGARAGRLMIQRCANCEAVTHPPGALCPVFVGRRARVGGSVRPPDVC